jgi:hypothetical protein
MTRIAIIFVLFFLFAIKLSANNPIQLSEKQLVVLVNLNDEVNLALLDSVNYDNEEVKFKRGKAIIFTVLTGLFGGHRIYFGTHHRTPIIYSVTLGGLGILPFIDLINIIFTKDLSKFDNKTQVIMWGN